MSRRATAIIGDRSQTNSVFKNGLVLCYGIYLLALGRPADAMILLISLSSSGSAKSNVSLLCFDGFTVSTVLIARFLIPFAKSKALCWLRSQRKIFWLCLRSQLPGRSTEDTR